MDGVKTEATTLPHGQLACTFQLITTKSAGARRAGLIDEGILAFDIISVSLERPHKRFMQQPTIFSLFCGP